MKIVDSFISIIFILLMASSQVLAQDSLKITISLSTRNFCIGNSLKVSTLITNISVDKLVVDVNPTKFNYSFRWTSKGKGGALNSSTGVSHYEPNFIVLQPNESYSLKNISTVLNKKNFTRKKYTMNIFYSQYLEANYKNVDVWKGLAKSNDIDISIRECMAKK